MNKKADIKRIYHHYKMWEDYKEGFYDNCSGKDKELKTQSVINMFSSPELTREYMTRVINEWTYSCQHNLSNSAVNKIAYIGQAACCLFNSVPNTVTMSAWSLVPKEDQEVANQIAKEVLNEWESKNKNIQVCLSIY